MRLSWHIKVFAVPVVGGACLMATIQLAWETAFHTYAVFGGIVLFSLLTLATILPRVLKRRVRFDEEIVKRYARKFAFPFFILDACLSVASRYGVLHHFFRRRLRCHVRFGLVLSQHDRRIA